MTRHDAGSTLVEAVGGGEAGEQPGQRVEVAGAGVVAERDGERRLVLAGDADFAIGVPGVGRFRTNVYQQRGSLAYAFRAVPSDRVEVSYAMVYPAATILSTAAGSSSRTPSGVQALATSSATQKLLCDPRDEQFLALHLRAQVRQLRGRDAVQRLHPPGEDALAADAHVQALHVALGIHVDAVPADNAPLLRLPDFEVGKTGVERSHERTLRGLPLLFSSSRKR